METHWLTELQPPMKSLLAAAFTSAWHLASSTHPTCNGICVQLAASFFILRTSSPPSFLPSFLSSLLSNRSIATPGRKHISFQPANNSEGEAAIIRVHLPPTTQRQHHPPLAAEAAAAGQNMGGTVKKGQAASADEDSRAQARKIAQAMKVTWGFPRRYHDGTSGGYAGPPNHGNGPPVL
eukprot:122477-Pelagomonas_calceolata.AAC.1